jgi:FkbM family methyltransferase
MKSQNDESSVVMSFFASLPAKQRCVLSIGENDGITFSNSYDLIMCGWKGVLIEPSPKAYSLLKEVHKENPNVISLNYGIANETGDFAFNESGSYKHTGNDVALLSSLIDGEMDRWGDDVAFEKVLAKFKTFEDFLKDVPDQHFDYISIDAEGYDYEILKQIDLNKVGCQCLCIEYNGKSDLWNLYDNYAKNYGMKMISQNPENLIFVK